MIIVAKEPSKFGEITILRYRGTSSHVYMQGGHFQSEADCNGISLTPYIHAMYGLLAQTAARRVLMIGCGGGTLATMLTKANRRVTIVEINPVSIVLAQRYFSLPPGITCHIDDGSTFLKRSRKSYDAIIVDAFIGDETPPELSSVDFFRLARQRLRTPGFIFVNVVAERDTETRADVVGARIARAGLEARVLDAPGGVSGNSIVIGGAAVNLAPPTLLLRPNGPYVSLSEELQGMRLRRWRPDLRC
ncbi:MAG TPA: fused MFS/spermidine synthase [Alphaproteobacteria bacterium]